jgi:hypothetical protein
MSSITVNLSSLLPLFARSAAVVGFLVNSTIVVVRGNFGVEVKENGL